MDGTKYGVDKVVMYCILAVVGANYLAQIPYNFHLYYVPLSLLPPPVGTLVGTLLLLATFVWFLLGWVLLARGSRIGFWVLLSFLLTEFAFYFYNMANQVAHGFAPFFHLQNPDHLLFTVFAIGYLNLIGAGVFSVYLVWRHRALGTGQQLAS